MSLSPRSFMRQPIMIKNALSSPYNIITNNVLPNLLLIVKAPRLNLAAS